MTAWWAALTDERKWRRDCGEALLRARLFHLHDLDAHLAKASPSCLCMWREQHVAISKVSGANGSNTSAYEALVAYSNIDQSQGKSGCWPAKPKSQNPRMGQVLVGGRSGAALEFAVHLVRNCLLAEPVLGAQDLQATLEVFSKLAQRGGTGAPLPLQQMVDQARRLAPCAPSSLLAAWACVQLPSCCLGSCTAQHASQCAEHLVTLLATWVDQAPCLSRSLLLVPLFCFLHKVLNHQPLSCLCMSDVQTTSIFVGQADT